MEATKDEYHKNEYHRISSVPISSPLPLSMNELHSKLRPIPPLDLCLEVWTQTSLLHSSLSLFHHQISLPTVPVLFIFKHIISPIFKNKQKKKAKKDAWSHILFQLTLNFRLSFTAKLLDRIVYNCCLQSPCCYSLLIQLQPSLYSHYAMETSLTEITKDNFQSLYYLTNCTLLFGLQDIGFTPTTLAVPSYSLLLVQPHAPWPLNVETSQSLVLITYWISNLFALISLAIFSSPCFKYHLYTNDSCVYMSSPALSPRLQTYYIQLSTQYFPHGYLTGISSLSCPKPNSCFSPFKAAPFSVVSISWNKSSILPVTQAPKLWIIDNVLYPTPQQMLSSLPLK